MSYLKNMKSNSVFLNLQSTAFKYLQTYLNYLLICPYPSNSSIFHFMQCQYCKTKAPTIPYCCSLCKAVFYCNIDCQKNDWPYHKKICQASNPQNNHITPPIDPSQAQNLQISDFEVIKTIGEGNFTIVKKVIHIPTQKVYALKIVDKFNVKRLQKVGDILMEKHALLKLKNTQVTIKIIATFQDQVYVYILMEYIQGGELWNHCRSFGLCSDILSRYYFFLIVQAVKVCHDFQILHRDLKPENIMVTNNGNGIKLLDFGSALDLENQDIRPKPDQKANRIHEFFVGTPQYMPPEQIRNKGSYKSSDVWSLGCILFQLYCGKTPFLGDTDYLIFQKSIQGIIQFPKGIVPNQAQNLINQMIKLEPDERISLEQILEDSFFDPVRNIKQKPTIELVDNCLISLKKYFIKNSSLIKLHLEEFEEDISKMEIQVATLPENYLIRLKYFIKLLTNFIEDKPFNFNE